MNVFETKSTKIRIEGTSNRSIINLIPDFSMKPIYSESLKTDFNELIYNCGGIIGMWSGLSPVSIAYITINYLSIKLRKIWKFIYFV